MTEGAKTPAPAELATDVARAFLRLAASVVSELELTASESRELFLHCLFEVAEERHESAARVAAALDTSARTVQNYRQKRGQPPSLSVFNMRRRVLALLDAGASDLEEIERRLPRGSDVNFARSALRGLVEEGLVSQDDSKTVFRRASEYVPWYERAGPEPTGVLRIICENLAQHFGSRYTPQAEIGATPASALAVVHRVAEADRERYMHELFKLIGDFDEAWSAREPTDPNAPTMGVELVFGPLPAARPLDEVRDAHEASARAARRAREAEDWPSHPDFVDDDKSE